MTQPHDQVVHESDHQAARASADPLARSKLRHKLPDHGQVKPDQRPLGFHLQRSPLTTVGVARFDITTNTSKQVPTTALLTATPGLVVVPAGEIDTVDGDAAPIWSLTHAESGMAIGRRSMFAADLVALAEHPHVAALTDWTADGRTLLQRLDVPAAKQLLREVGDLVGLRVRPRDDVPTREAMRHTMDELHVRPAHVDWERWRDDAILRDRLNLARAMEPRGNECARQSMIDACFLDAAEVVRADELGLLPQPLIERAP